MKVTNQMACLAVAKQVLQPERIYHNYLAQVTGAQQLELVHCYWGGALISVNPSLKKMSESIQGSSWMSRHVPPEHGLLKE